jgi:signal transduction histidine kinase
MLSADDYRKLFEYSPASLLVLDKNFTIIGATEQYLTDTFSKRSDLLNKHIFDIFTDDPGNSKADGVEKLNRSLNKVLEEKCADVMAMQRYDIIGPAGQYEERYWTPYNMPLLDDKGEVMCIIHRVEDVTQIVNLRQKAGGSKNPPAMLQNDLLQVELSNYNRDLLRANQELHRLNDELRTKAEELKRSNEELSNFAMTASHDIQAPFRVVGNYLGLIQERMKVLEDEKLNGYFEKIYSSRERIKNLLSNLLQFGMVSNASVVREKLDLGAVINDVLSNLETNIREKNAKVIVSDKLPTVTGSASQLLQLFQNLISNAIKFTHGKPLIKVSVRENGSEYIFSVEDNGVGIEKEYFTRIFEVFQRLNSQSEFPGSGLGLAICKKIVDHHGGKIWVESSPGKGTCFYFSLPG